MDRRYKLNRTGPNTEPCGTPNLITMVSDVVFPSLILWVLPIKKLLNHDKTVPLNPISFSRIPSKMWWSTVSNAAERSSNITIVAVFSSVAISRSLTIFISRVSVLWCFLYANWSAQLRLFLARWSFRRLRIGVGLTGDFFGHYVKIKKGVVRYVLALAKSGLVPFFEPKVEIWLIPPYWS